MTTHRTAGQTCLPALHPLPLAIAQSLRPPTVRWALSAGLAAVLATASPLYGATFTVTNTDDAGAGSLRAAIDAANAAPGRDAISFASHVSGIITLTSGPLFLTEQAEILGPGPEVLSIDGAAEWPILIAEGDGLKLTGLRLTNAGGEGITVEVTTPGDERRTVEIGDCIVEKNAGPGLRLFSVGDVAASYQTLADFIIENTVIEGNGGSAIVLGSATTGMYDDFNAEIRDSVLSGNLGRGVEVAGGYGGHAVAIDSSEIVDNTTGISIFGASVAVRNTSISGNSGNGVSSVEGGGPNVALSRFSAEDSVIADNGGDGVFGSSIGCARSLVTGNAGWGLDGVPSYTGASVSVDSCAIIGNGAGGVRVTNNGFSSSLALNNSTVSENGGDGVYAYGFTVFATIASSTITGNARTSGTGGVYGYSYRLGGVTIQGSVVSNSASDLPDLVGLGPFYADYSLVEDPGAVDIIETTPGSNIVGRDAMLGPLQDNGGPTPTHALLPGSPAIDAGDPDFAPPPEFDQRGEGFDRIVGGRIDMGAFEVQGVPSPTALYALDALGRVDANASSDLGMLKAGIAGEPSNVAVKDSATKAFIGEVPFDGGDNRALGLTGVEGLDEGVGVAVLFSKPDGQGIVQIKDGLTGDWIRQMAFVGKAWQVQAITGLDLDGNGRDEIAVLATTDDGRSAGVQIRDAVSKAAVSWVGFPMAAGSTYLGLASLPDTNGNGTPELAALRKLADSTLEVLVKDGVTKQPISTVSFGQQTLPALGLAPVNNTSGNGSPEVAVLLKKQNGQGLVQVRDASSGAWVTQMQFVGKEWEVQALTSQDSDLDGVSELSVLATKDDGSAVGVQIRDAITKEQVNWVSFPAD